MGTKRFTGDTISPTVRQMLTDNDELLSNHNCIEQYKDRVSNAVDCRNNH